LPPLWAFAVASWLSAFTLSSPSSRMAWAQAISTGQPVRLWAAEAPPRPPTTLAQRHHPLYPGLQCLPGRQLPVRPRQRLVSILTPGIAFRFNRLLSVKRLCPIYALVNVESTPALKPNPLHLHHPNTASPAMPPSPPTSTPTLSCSTTTPLFPCLPSGNTATASAPAAKTPTTSNNHLEKSFGILSLTLNSARHLQQPHPSRIRKTYTTRGALATSRQDLHRSASQPELRRRSL